MFDFSKRLSCLLPDVLKNQFSINPLRGTLIKWRDRIEDFITFYYSLGDDNSKDLFFKLLRYNIGFSFSGFLIQDKYAIYTNNEWDQLIKNVQNKKNIYVEHDYILDRIEVYELKGYEYKDLCIAREGDYVFDCGAYTGNTGIYFSNLVKEKGKVFSLEAHPDTFEILCKNVQGFKNIYSYNFAVVDKSKFLKFSKKVSPGSKIVQGNDSIEVRGISIDEFVKQNHIDKVDFIKMDIEGAELDALNGCSEVCKKFSPKLAICIYHKAEDWVTIPQKIMQLNKNYNFYLKHNSNSFFETVLFAIHGKSREIKIDKEEVTVSKNIFDAIINLHQQCNLNFRKELLLRYIEKTKLNKNIVFPQYNSNYMYVYFPLSVDHRLHYELSFSGNMINISLHLEEKWNNFSSIFDIANLQLDVFSDVNYKQGPFKYGYEISYQYEDVYNIDSVAKIFNFLIKKTLPVLKLNKLISSSIFFDLQ